MKSRRFWTLLVALLFLISILFQYRFPIAKSLGTYLAKSDPLEKCEAIFAPSSRIETNFAYAVHLLKEGWGNRLVVTTSKLTPLTKRFRETYGLMNCSEISILRQVFQKEKLPIEKLTILEDSTSSFVDCKLLHAHWEKHPFRSLIVVTDAPHARRFRMVLDKVFGDADVKILSCPSFPSRPLEDFFADKEDYVMYVLSEYVKIIAYALKYALG
ncbi:MAG: YdcF family protein [Deltaproteobacteria bacterium]|nr:YdcF family protein [Deltaproteobacteria bacterium]MBW2019899.1 YdcF family protein [Deltaproteobacteria bacterium]MBW2074955.1 YdcF family protein [Deltaproteobacteria bacterium]RLB82422.1 MAG: hypothetical protein DRH17_05790 [Deltaproteobacteria bacterium]